MIRKTGGQSPKDEEKILWNTKTAPYIVISIITLTVAGYQARLINQFANFETQIRETESKFKGLRRKYEIKKRS
jgi:hypothetical protein